MKSERRYTLTGGLDWFKVMSNIFDNDKIIMIESLPEGDTIIVIWFKMLALAAKQNNSGVFMMRDKPYTDEMFAAIFRRPIATVRLALQTFVNFGMIDIEDNTIIIHNWGKYQSADSMDKRNAYMREYMQNYREKQKLLASGDKTANSKPNSKPNSKTNTANSKTNVSSIEREREREADADEEAPFPINNSFESFGDDERPDFDTVQVYAANNLRSLTADALDELTDFANKLSPELVRYAINAACAAGAPFWNYTRAILTRYCEQDIRTVADAKAAEEKYKLNKEQPEHPDDDGGDDNWVW